MPQKILLYIVWLGVLFLGQSSQYVSAKTRSTILDSLQVLYFQIGEVEFDMQRVDGGVYVMGGTIEQHCEVIATDLPAHTVSLDAYYIATTEVTQALWNAVMPDWYISNEWKTPTLPITDVNWYDCQEFIHRLDSITGMPFRLPTEAEWEYAARGGHLSKGYKYPGSNNPDDVAWTKYTVPDSKIKPVKQLLPNELGLYDMAGNVWEWVLDYNRPYTVEPQVDPIGDLSSNQAFMRGGSTYDAYTYLHNMVSYRGETFAKTYKSTRVGFRFVLDADGILEDNQIYVTSATICAGDAYIWDANNKTYTQSGSYTDTIQNIYGCDSIVDLNIVVNQALYVNFDSLVTVCADENSFNVGYDIISGKILSYTAQIVSDANSYDETEVLRPIDSQLVIPMPENIVPGIYTLNVKFGDESCGGGKDGEMIPLMVLYSKEVLVQRWNDVLALKNSEYNGGYEFVAYQWFLNGVPLEGFTGSQLYVENQLLDFGGEYRVLLTRADDGVAMMTCGLIPTEFTEEQMNDVGVLVFFTMIFINLIKFLFYLRNQQ